MERGTNLTGTFCQLFLPKSHNPSERNLKDGKRDKFDMHFLSTFLQKFMDKLTGSLY